MTTTFKADYKKAILAKMRELKAGDTVQMGEDCFWANVRVPPGGPPGTNCAFHAKEIFREIVRSTPALKKFTY